MKFGTSFELKTWIDQIKDIKLFRSAPDFLHVVFSVLPWALLGITLLILIYLIWMNRSGEDLPKNAENLKTQSQNAVLISFEQRRRNVDNDPAKYIDENIPPKSAIDIYLLGRAHFLQKNYSQAKIYLEQAKRDLLNENFSMTNRKALQNEILMMMTIIDTPDARETFERSY
jgi:phage gp46-like protein